jgi:uncharacterized membrane protein
MTRIYDIILVIYYCKEGHMRKTAAVIGVVTALGLTGCATKGFVQSQTAPLEERIGKLEERAKALETAVAQPARLSDVDNARINQAGDNARQALDTANRAATEAAGANVNAKRVDDATAKAEGAAARSEDAAKRAEASAIKAEDASKSAQQAGEKSEKLFRLNQKK